MQAKRALITGATGGIGAAIAKTFVKEGWHVALSGTNNDKLESLTCDLKEIAQSTDGNVFGVVGKLNEPDEPTRIVQAAKEALGGIDVLVNNAGITRDGLLMRMKDEDWEAVLTLNLTAVMRLCRAVMRDMMAQRSGAIVNISSVVASMGNAGQGNYVAAKAGLEGLTRSLALEVAGRGIRVNNLAPGFIETPMTEKLSAVQREAIGQKIPLKKMGQPQDVAEAALFLASDRAAYITGTTLHVNGGLFCG